MNCTFDLKEYALGESARDEALQIESHLAECAGCSEELARLQLSQRMLLTLGEEEPPRRIAFVSDQVFEPRWYRRLWNSGPQLGFLAASMLACALLVHAFAPAQFAPALPGIAAVASAEIEERVEREVSARLDAAVQSAVTQAVADSEARQMRKTAELLQASEQRYELDRRATIAAFAEQTRLLQKQVSAMYVTANNMGAGE